MSTWVVYVDPALMDDIMESNPPVSLLAPPGPPLRRKMPLPWCDECWDPVSFDDLPATRRDAHKWGKAVTIR
jgi:hypothetical protein